MAQMTDDLPSGGSRPGEVSLADDPAAAEWNAGLVFIGFVSSAWRERAACPKNTREARERGTPARIFVDEPFRAGLANLSAPAPLVILTWLHRARRDLISQVPRHADGPRGTFSLRSPVRPNPIGLHVVGLTGLDLASGWLEIDGIDVVDGTPLLDIKPWFATTDVGPAPPATGAS